MLPIVGALIERAIGGLIDGAKKVVDSKVDQAEKELQLKVLKETTVSSLQTQVLDAVTKQEAELTERLKADDSSDSKLAKNIRPGVFAWLTVLITILAVTDGNISLGQAAFTVKPIWVDLLKNAFELFLAFYVGSRGLEKVASIVSDVWKK